jgi:hypothetical protein
MKAALTGLVLLSVLAGLATGDPTDPSLALREGNRLFEQGEMEAALTAYAAGWQDGDGESDALLAYNLGTTALHLGRLPEALLWYRRAEAAAAAEDPWLRDNLEIVRRSLTAAPGEAPGSAWAVWAVWMGAPRWLTIAGVVLAWAALALLVLPGRLRRRPAAAAAVFACAAFLAGLLLDRYGPRAAVLLAPCPGAGRPAGSEVWVLRAGEDTWRVLGDGEDSRCSAAGVGLVNP